MVLRIGSVFLDENISMSHTNIHFWIQEQNLLFLLRGKKQPIQVLTKCSKSFRNGRENIHDDVRFQACNKVHVVLGQDFQ